MRYFFSLAFLLFSLTLFASEGDIEKPQIQDIHQEKSYLVAVPLAFFVGFGSGHFYAKDTWGGIRYIAYDVAGLGLGFLTLYLDDYSDRSILFAVAVLVVNRIYQAVSAAESVHYYNKNPMLRELDLFEHEKPQRQLSQYQNYNILKLELMRF